jgi:type IV pilus assembly protein PilN
LLGSGLLVAALLQYGAARYFDYQQGRQQVRNQRLNQQITLLDSKIRELAQAQEARQSLLMRLEQVELLQNARNKTTELMNLLPTLVPTGVYIDKVKLDGYQLELAGISDSTVYLATMLKNFEHSAQMLEMDIYEIVHGEARFGKQFQTFRVSLRFEPASYESASHKLNRGGVKREPQ